jgi:hypothetical protein
MRASWAANEARIGKPLKAVLAASTRMNRVAAWTRRNAGPSPRTCLAIWEMTVGSPLSNGSASSCTAR